jgi:hypothetical protein
MWSEYFIKYIGNTFLTYDEGSAAIVDLARCEDGMSNILLQFGYTERFRIKKKGKICRYRNKPIVILTYNMEKPTEQGSEQRQGGYNIQYLEVIGYCYESDSTAMKNDLNSIKSKLSK